MSVLHYWNFGLHKCRCGCRLRVLACGDWVCFDKLRDELAKQDLLLLDTNHKRDFK